VLVASAKKKPSQADPDDDNHGASGNHLALRSSQKVAAVRAREIKTTS
jgi:hypothetical protein